MCPLAKVLVTILGFLRGFGSLSSKSFLSRFPHSLLPEPVSVGAEEECRQCLPGTEVSDSTESPGKGRSGPPTFCLVVIHQWTGCPQGHRAELRVPPPCVHSIQGEPGARQENRAPAVASEKPGQACKEAHKPGPRCGGENAGCRRHDLQKNKNKKVVRKHSLSANCLLGTFLLIS